MIKNNARYLILCEFLLCLIRTRVLMSHELGSNQLASSSVVHAFHDVNQRRVCYGADPPLSSYNARRALLSGARQTIPGLPCVMQRSTTLRESLSRASFACRRPLHRV
ncbi:hypothetical protein BD311DRAFT_112549 [Dichomitus squalens]|uniref:Secreted protein n=1 Tax=Dichomitus squalens TaxID=114155 RepID=A0A4Q9M7C5_9APHY|nr:hypothetical protein BD311DRAFT_112549 [Dichomitus squalens]